MKPLLIGSLVLAQLGLAPASAATIEGDSAVAQQRVGTFAGTRFQVPFGGPRAGKASIGVGLSGITQSRSTDGKLAARFSEGVQLGVSAGGPLGLTVAGQPLARRKLAAQDAGEEEKEEGDGGISTLGVVGIVAGGLLVAGGIGLALFMDAMGDASE